MKWWWYLQWSTDAIYKWSEKQWHVYKINFINYPPTCYCNLIVSFLVVPQDIQVEEGLAIKGAHQPHTQVHFSNMGADSCLWGWWALSAAFNRALIYSLSTPSWILRGCIWAGMSPTEAGGAGTVAWPSGSEASGPVDSWGGSWEMEELGTRGDLCNGGWERRRWEYEVTPLKSP